MGLQKILFVKQLDNHCGPAALEMVYKFFGLNNVSQGEIFQSIKKQKDTKGNIYVNTIDLVSDAKSRGFKSFWFDLKNLSDKEVIDVLKEVVEKNISVITCGQWRGNRDVGHFRVILGVDEVSVYFHDPDIYSEKGFTKYTHDSFLGYWKNRGETIPGNTGFIVCKLNTPIPAQIQNYLK